MVVGSEAVALHFAPVRTTVSCKQLPMRLLPLPVALWTQRLLSESRRDSHSDGRENRKWCFKVLTMQPLQSFVGEYGTVTELVIDHLTKQERIDLGIHDQSEEEMQDQEQEQPKGAATATRGHMISQSQTHTESHTASHQSNHASINPCREDESPSTFHRSHHEWRWIEDACGLSSTACVLILMCCIELKDFQNKNRRFCYK